MWLAVATDEASCPSPPRAPSPSGYVGPGKIDSDTQIAKLSENIEQARAQGKPVPPGVHAHLGYLYFLQGNPSAAQQEFETEKSLFPESAVFVDGLVQRMSRK